MQRTPDISIVVPLLDEEENVALLVRAVRDALEEVYAWELILVDDGSRDRTFEEGQRECSVDDRVRMVRLAKNYGQTTAMQAGFDHAKGQVVVSMDGDLQNDPRDIPRLVARIREGYDVVAGYRESRSENLITRRVPSWFANRLIRYMVRVPIRDNGCTLKAFRADVLKPVRFYSDLHRFIPAVLAGTTATRIVEVPVRHNPRRFGTTKYGISRVWKVLADLLSVAMIRWFRDRPLAMFGWGATGAAVVGSIFLAATLISATTFQPLKADALVFPGATLLWFFLAVYLLMLGLICEVVRRDAKDGESVTGENDQ